jgi:hypothetical protein
LQRGNLYILINLIPLFLKEKSKGILVYNLIIIKRLLKRINKKEGKERERERERR